MPRAVASSPDGSNSTCPWVDRILPGVVAATPDPPLSPGRPGSAPPVRPSRVRSHPTESAGQDCAPAPGAATSEPRNAPADARPREQRRFKEPLPQWLLRRGGKKKKKARREGRVRPHRAGRRVPEATGGARIAGRAHRGPHSACRLTRPAPSGPRCHCPGRLSTGSQSVHPSVTLPGRPGDDEHRSLGRPAGLRSSNFRLPGAVASNNSPSRRDYCACAAQLTRDF